MGQHEGACVEGGCDVAQYDHHQVDEGNDGTAAAAVAFFKELGRGGQLQSHVDADEEGGEEDEANRPDDLKAACDDADGEGEPGLSDELLAGDVGGEE